MALEQLSGRGQDGLQAGNELLKLLRGIWHWNGTGRHGGVGLGSPLGGLVRLRLALSQVRGALLHVFHSFGGGHSGLVISGLGLLELLLKESDCCRAARA
eukprot:806676-Pyramimonas_sp.AAC.1